jgi:hypothetical protein
MTLTWRRIAVDRIIDENTLGIKMIHFLLHIAKDVQWKMNLKIVFRADRTCVMRWSTVILHKISCQSTSPLLAAMLCFASVLIRTRASRT